MFLRLTVTFLTQVEIMCPVQRVTWNNAVAQQLYNAHSMPSCTVSLSAITSSSMRAPITIFEANQTGLHHGHATSVNDGQPYFFFYYSRHPPSDVRVNYVTSLLLP